MQKPTLAKYCNWHAHFYTMNLFLNFIFKEGKPLLVS
jgi:hypothetical protein